MAGYTYNFRNNPPEYSQIPSADSVNGTKGTNTPAAQQNQQTIASQNKRSTGDPYQAFHDAPMGWPAPAPPPTTVSTAPPESNLAATLKGGPMPQTTGAPLSAQSLSGVLTASAPPVGPSMPGFVIPPVPEFPSMPPYSGYPSMPPNTNPQPVSSTPTYGGNGNWAMAQSTPAPSTNFAGEGPGGGGPINQLPGDEPTGPGPGGTVPPPPAGTTPPPPAATAPPPTGGRTRATLPVTTHNDPLHYDANGVPWSETNPPPNPGNTEDSTVAAGWYSKFNFYDPTLINVTAKDVENYRISGYNAPPDILAKTPGKNNFIAWWQNQKPMPAQTPPPPGGEAPTGTPPVNNWVDPMLGGPKAVVPGGPIDPNDPNYARIIAARGEQNPTQPAPTIPGTTPPAGTPPPAATPPPGTGTEPPPSTLPPGATAPPPGTPPGQAQALDVAGMMRGLYGPQFNQEQSELARVLRSQAAFQDPNLPSSGGFQESLGRAESNLVNQQGARLGEYTNQALDRAQQFAIAQMDDATKRFGIKSNDDLQRWLNSADSNTIAVLGINKQDLLERYKAQLALEGTKYSADAGVSAASLHAAAAQAAAAANSAASLAEIQAKQQMFGEQNKLDWAQLQANLYMSGQQNYVTELGFLMNSGLSANDALAILGIFGGSGSVFVNP